MSIASILGAALKNLSWGKVASLALEYAPVLYRQARERLQPDELPTGGTPAETALQERINRLEELLLEQEDLLREQTAKSALLEKRCAGLESLLLIFKTICGGLLIAGAVMLILLLKQL